MMHTFLSFLSHGGFKLLIFGFILLSQFARARAKIAKKREAELRGNTGISDFSAPAALAANPTLPSNTASKSGLASPWSSDQNPFDNKS